MGDIRILHISDLHLAGSLNEHQIRTDFFADLRLRQPEQPVDLVVFTGDLVAAGSDLESFQRAESEFIEPLLELLNLDISRFVLVPGNHDIDRDSTQLWVEQALSSNELMNSDGVDAWLADPGNSSFYEGKMANFAQFVEEHLPHQRKVGQLGYQVAAEIRGVRVELAVANSAWRSRGRGDDLDKEMLLVGRSQLNELVQAQAPDSHLTLLALHHPLEWLKAFDRDAVKSRLRHFDFVLCGHSHDPDTPYRLDKYGPMVTSQAGALYQGEEYPNTYALLEVDVEGRQLTSHVRRWYEARGEFDVDSSVASGGVATRSIAKLSGDPEAAPAAQRQSRVVDLPSSLLGKAATELRLLQAESASDEDPYAELIDPPAFSDRYSEVLEAERGGRRGLPLDLRSLINEHQSDIAFLGGANAGRTCALHWAVGVAAKARDLAPIVVDGAQLARSESSLVQTVRRSLRSVGVKVDASLTDAPPLLVAVDNFDPLNHSEHVRRLKTLQPDSQLLVAAFDDAVSPRVSEWGYAEFASAYLAPYQIEQVRNLVARMYPGSQDEWNSMVRSTSRLLLSQGLDRSPWTVVVALMLYRYEPELQKADPTALTDKYVDLVLGKWQTAIDPSVADAVDHVTRRDFLVHLAVELTRQSVRSLTAESFRAFAETYLTDRGQIVDPDDLLDDLVRRRVLGGTADRVEFFPSSLLAFFQALAVQRGHLALEEILVDSASFEAALHLAGLSRDRRDLLVALSDRLDTVVNALPPLGSTLFQTMDPEVWGAEPEVDQTLRALERLGHSAAIVQNEDYQDLVADELLKSRDEQSSDSPPSVDSANENTNGDGSGYLEQLAGIRLLADSVVLLSLVLQRSELVPDPGLKRDLIAKSVRAWSKVFVSICAADVRMLEERREAEASGAGDSSAMAVARLRAHLEYGTFIEVSGAALDFLSAPRLVQSYTEIAVAGDIEADDLVARLIMALLLVANTDREWEPYLDLVRSDFKGRAHVSRLIHRMLGFRYFDLNTPEPVLRQIEDRICEVVAENEPPRNRRQVEDGMRERLRSSRARMAAASKQSLVVALALNTSTGETAIEVEEVQSAAAALAQSESSAAEVDE